MTEEILVQCCAPTLAGLKTGSLFSCPYSDQGALQTDIRRLNQTLSSRGMRILPLRYVKTHVLVSVFRPELLQQDLKDKKASAILKKAGYEDLGVYRCIRCLIERLRQSQDFPHEIGLFLSYPPEDVQGFIDNKAQNYKCIGYWKVYGDEDKARRIFEIYKKCTDTYCRQYRAGCGLVRLAVAV